VTDVALDVVEQVAPVADRPAEPDAPRPRAGGPVALQEALAAFLAASRAAFAVGDDPCGVLSANNDIHAPHMRVGWSMPGAVAAPGFFLIALGPLRRQGGGGPNDSGLSELNWCRRRLSPRRSAPGFPI
jgi:hypothetical protein